MINIIAPRGPLRMGQRTYITAPTGRQAAEYREFLNRNMAYHKPWVHHSTDPDYFDQYLRRIKRGVTQGCFVLEVKSDRLLGVININNILLGPIRSASLGYYGDRNYAGTGHMTEAMGLVLKYAVEDLGLHRLEANIQPGNIPSIRLVQKLGFTKEGFSPKYLQIAGKWRDHERWAILDEDILLIK